MSAEQQYLDLCQEVLATGSIKTTRGHKHRSIIGNQLKFNLFDKDNNKHILPLLTTKKMFTKGIIEELLWFLRGQTDSKILEETGVNIWSHNSTKEQVDKVNRRIKNIYEHTNVLVPYDWVDLDPTLQEKQCGPVYGAQIRSFNYNVTPYIVDDYETGDRSFSSNWVNANGITLGDQFTNLIYNLKHDPFSRRHIISMWNPLQIDFAVLPPCHILYHFIVEPDSEVPTTDDGESVPKYLTLCMTQRSGDLPLGVPFNMSSCAFLMYIVGHLTGLTPYKLVHTINDAHVYENQVETMTEQLQRQPYPFPTVELNLAPVPDNFYDQDSFVGKLNTYLDNITREDFVIKDYQCHPALKYEFST